MKSLLDRYEEEGLVPSYAPNYVRSLQLNIPGWGLVEVKVDHQKCSSPAAEVYIGFQHIEIRGEFLLSDSPEEIVKKIFSSSDGRRINSAIDSYNSYKNSFGENAAWVKANLPWSDGEIEIRGEIKNGREICIEVEKNGREEGIDCIYSVSDAEVALDAYRNRLIVRYSESAPKEELVNPSKSKKIAFRFQEGKPKKRAFAMKF